jgi:hypothetical protein
MSNWLRGHWVDSIGKRRRKRASRLDARSLSEHRRLRFEILEDRRLLSITVNTLLDELDGSIADGDISLRDAIFAAPTGETIDFSPALTSAGPASLKLTLGQLTIARDLTIIGPGASLLTIDAGNGADQMPGTGDGTRIFYCDAFLQVRGVTITGGDVSSGDSGGAIVAKKKLSVVDSVISGNSAGGNGGGIYSHSYRSYSTEIVNSTVSGNVAMQGGGGVWLQVFDPQVPFLISTSNISNSTISGNRAKFSAGIGANLERGCFVTVKSSTISGNAGSNGGGGIGVVISGGGGMIVSYSAIHDNSAKNGGGIRAVIVRGSLNVHSSTISGNMASHDGGGAHITSYGVATFPSAIEFSTITQNISDADNSGGVGGGVVLDGPSEYVLRNSIVAQNFRGNLPYDIAGSVSIASISNLVGVGVGLSGVTHGVNGNIVGALSSPIDPRLGELTNNGGQTKTHALLIGSQAIDAGDGTGSFFNPQFDQRGDPFSRVANGVGVGDEVDIGAFELQSSPAVPSQPGDYNFGGFVDAADYVLWRKTLNTAGVPAYTGSDGDGDTTIDQDDYGVWRAHYGQSVAPKSRVREASSASSAELKNQSIGHDPGTRLNGTDDRHAVTKAGVDPLLLLLAIDSVGHSLRQDSFGNDFGKSDEYRVNDDGAVGAMTTASTLVRVNFRKIDTCATR